MALILKQKGSESILKYQSVIRIYQTKLHPDKNSVADLLTKFSGAPSLTGPNSFIFKYIHVFSLL